MTQIKSRADAVNVLLGETCVEDVTEDVPCRTCGDTIQANQQAVFVKPKGGGKPTIGPFCRLLCKVKLDMHALTHIIQ